MNKARLIKDRMIIKLSGESKIKPISFMQLFHIKKLKRADKKKTFCDAFLKIKQTKNLEDGN